MVKREPDDHSHIYTAGASGQHDSAVPAKNVEPPKLTVSSLIGRIGGQSRGARRTASSPRRENVPSGRRKADSGYVPPASKPGDSLEKDWAAGRHIKSNRTAVTPFGIVNLKIAPLHARSGETIVISFEATNNSDFHSIYPVTIKVNEQVVAAEVVSIPPRFALPMRAGIIGAEPGEYTIEVNFTVGKFIVLNQGGEINAAVPMSTTPDIGNLDAEFDRSLLEIASSAETHKKPVEAIHRPEVRQQDVIDKAANYIELVLDKLGDALVFPIKKLVEIFTSKSESNSRKMK